MHNNYFLQHQTLVVSPNHWLNFYIILDLLFIWGIVITSEIDLSQFFCWNEDCPDYGIKNQGNIFLKDRYGKKQHSLLKCKTCKRCFSETRCTDFSNSILLRKKFWSCPRITDNKNFSAFYSNAGYVLQGMYSFFLNWSTTHGHDLLWFPWFVLMVIAIVLCFVCGTVPLLVSVIESVSIS